MLVKMRTLAAGPNGVLDAGVVYDLAEELATSLVELGYAERIGKVLETAALQPVQNAMAKRPQPRGV